MGSDEHRGALTRHLAAALSRHGSCRRLDGSEIGDPAGAAVPGEPPVARFGPLLDRTEADHDLVILDAGTVGVDRPWTSFCLQQADRIVALTRGGPVPDAARAWPELQGCELVALDVVPGTGALTDWAALAPAGFHVVRADHREGDLARLARRLSGRSLGIVLSGGGARALAHIGVLEELTAAGVAIDRVAGVSIGAFVGALFAIGLDAEQIDERCFEEWVQRRPLGDFTIPRHALVRGNRLRSMLERTFGSWMIEELPTAFTCGSTELRGGRLMMGRQGELADAVSLSLCPPILVPPQIRGDHVFVDGSLIDNLPVTAMVGLGEGLVVAVDAAGSGSFANTDQSRDAAARPSIVETLARVLALSSASAASASARQADILINAAPDGVGLMEFHQLDKSSFRGRGASAGAGARGRRALCVHRRGRRRTSLRRRGV